ncbi:Rne/Rng family ribonuclease [Streptomyces sp. NPDC054765]
MLEPIEPTSSTPSQDRGADDNHSPSDTLPPRRRRRAASRPAGPPVAGAAETAVVSTDTDTAAAADPALAEEATASAVTTGDEAKPARTRRRATRKVTSPSGAPQPAVAEQPEAAAEPAVAETPAEAPAEAPQTEDAAPRRSRRRATRKVTAPAGAPQAEEGQEPAAAEAPAPAARPVEAPAESAPAESAPAAEETEDAAPRRSRRRATRKVTAPAGAPQAGDAGTEAAPVEAAAPVESTTADAPAAEEEAPAPAEDAKPARTRRRATRKVTAPAGAPQAAEEAPEPAEAEAEEAPAAAAGTDETPRRRARRRGERAAEPAAEAPRAEEEPAQEAPQRGRRRAQRPPTAVFQAPVFTEPMFQTPESAAAAHAAARQEETVTEQVVEEQPAAGARRRRRRGAPEAPEQVSAAPAEEPETEEATEAEAEQADSGHGEDESADRPSRRRRRGGRRRRRGESAEGGEEQPAEGAGEHESAQPESEEDDEQAAGHEAQEEADEQSGGGSSSSRRRRRRRRRTGDTGEDGTGGTDDPERTVVKVREPRKKDESTSADEVQSIKGSTRLEAKKQRRREGREQGRRRVPIITEAEFLARREAVERVMVVRQSGERTQIGVLEDNVLVEHFVNKEQATSYVGNVYLGKVQNVLPSMEAAFVDIGKGRNAVLYAGEVNFEALGMSNGPRRIETALKSGQSVLVQVTKDPIGHKGARLTSQVSLPGRYLVYVPEGSMTGISRKLPDTERARLKQILKKIVPEDAGVIVRTAAEGASEDELARDVQRLQAQWEEIQKKAKSGGSANAPSLLYGEPDMTVRVVRDIFNEDFSKVIVSGDDAWETIHGYVAHVAPDLTDRLQKWTSDVDVFATYRIDEQLMKALDRKVWLPSGGSLVIDKTEAMVVIDVNTGKFTGQGGNLEETVTRNNLEAAEEIVRQLRLRDLGGIVVIDFIDMVLESNRDLVLRRMLECLGRDRTKHQVAEVTSLGLVQMTRKRVGQGLLESFSESCVHCNGRGVIVHMDQPTTAGGGGKRKKKGKGTQPEPHVHEAEAEAVEAAPDGGAPELEPAPVTEAELQPAVDGTDEWFGSPAEAEAAAGRGRGRRRASRKVSAPAGAPKAAEEAAAIVVPAEPAPAAEPEPAPEPAEVTEPVGGAGAEAEPAAKKATAKKAAAKKTTTAKKTAAKKTTAKKAAAKKTTTAKKATAKKTTTKKATTKKAAAKKTAAAEQAPAASVSASTED